MSYYSPLPYRDLKKYQNIKPSREDRLLVNRENILKKLRSRFKFKEFSYEANYKFFKLAYEKGTCAVYLPPNIKGVNKYDSLIVFDYIIPNGVKSKNNLPLSIRAIPEEVKNSGGLLPSGDLEIGKDVVLYWTNSANHISDMDAFDRVFNKDLVNIDEIIYNVCKSSQFPILVSYRNKNNRGVNNLLDDIKNNQFTVYISEQEAGNFKPFQLSFDAHNYITALLSVKSNTIDNALAYYGFKNLGRAETPKKDRVINAEIKVESDATNESLFDKIHNLQEFSKRFEDCFKLILTVLISIYGAYVDLITALQYYKLKGAGGAPEQLTNILDSYNKFTSNNVEFGRSANSFTQDNQNSENIGDNYGPDADDRRNNNEWLNNLQLGNYTYIPYEPNGPSYTQSFFGNLWNLFMRGLDLYRNNDIEPSIESNTNNYISFNNQNNNQIINEVNPSLPFFYRLVNYVARRNFNTIDNQYQHLFDIDESKPIQKQDLLKNLDNVFSEKSSDYRAAIKYYFYLIQSYLKAGLTLSLPTLVIASIMASSYYFHMASNSFEDLMNNYIKDLNSKLPSDKSWLDLYRDNYEALYSDDYSSTKNIMNILLFPIILPYKIFKATGKATLYKNLFPSILNANWILKIGKYLILFLIRNIIYSFSYRVSYGLIDFLNKDGSSIAKHYITTFNAALITGFMSEQKDYRLGLKYALSTTLSHHLQTILYFANKLNRVEKNKIIRLLNKWNDNILFLFPKDLMAYFISSLIVDNIINVILDPNEGPIKKGSKFIINILSKTSKFTYDAFANILKTIFGKPIENINNLTLDETSNYLSQHFDFILNFLQDTTMKFYESVKDYLMKVNHPFLFLNKLKEENKNILEESDINIINENPLDIEKEKREIEEEAKPIINNFINEMIKGESYEQAAQISLQSLEDESLSKSKLPPLKIKGFNKIYKLSKEEEPPDTLSQEDKFLSKWKNHLLDVKRKFKLLSNVIKQTKNRKIIKNLYDDFKRSLTMAEKEEKKIPIFSSFTEIKNRAKDLQIYKDFDKNMFEIIKQWELERK